MHLSTLYLKNFRNHTLTSIDCGRGINFLLGNNGQGKTNVVEAISYLCLTKSFYAGSDTLVLRFGEGMFEIEGTLVSDEGRPHEIRVAYLRENNEKYFMVNRRRIEPLSSVIGKFPIVIFSPEHGGITTGGPAGRRKFLDLVVSQSSGSYFQTILDYRNVLKQRNRVLLDMKLNRAGGPGLLDAWDEQLVRLGCAIWAKRRSFIAEFEPIVRSVYSRFVDGGREEPSLVYRPLNLEELPESPDEAAGAFRRELREKENVEKRFGTTLVGPHRDEVTFVLNGLEMRSFASQGQHKTFVISLKLAEFLYLRSRCGETPLLLLDDVFAELDDERTAKVIGYIENIGQAFLTSTHRQLIDSWNLGREECRCFLIEGGAVAEQKAVHHA
ncbi:MAG TPA: DNA replication/repair protein RecF [Bacteroidota bacterium]|nr:DNA replication/repair protein RecF [Bacteroidota bacterium]